MNATVLMAVGLVLVFEGVGPMCFPQTWRKMIQAMQQFPDVILRRLGGGLVVAGGVIYYMVSTHLGG